MDQQQKQQWQRQQHQAPACTWSLPAADPAAPPAAAASLWQAQQQQPQLPRQQYRPAWAHAPLGATEQQSAVVASPRAMMTAADLLGDSSGDGSGSGGLSQPPPFPPPLPQPQHQPFYFKPAASPFDGALPMAAADAAAVTSRFFTQRVAAGPPSPRQPMPMQIQPQPQPPSHSRPSPPQPQTAQAAPAMPLRPLLFSSHALLKLRPLLQFGQQQPSADRAPFPPPDVSLARHFTLRQSASIAADIVITGARSLALLVITDKEMQQAEQRKKFLQRSDGGD